MSEQDTIEMLEEMEKRRVVKQKKCIYCKKEFSLRVLPNEVLACPHCACVQMSKLQRIKHGFLFQRGHPAYPHTMGSIIGEPIPNLFCLYKKSPYQTVAEGG